MPGTTHCGCCGMPRRPGISNPPGLPAIAYRSGTHGTRAAADARRARQAGCRSWTAARARRPGDRAARRLGHGRRRPHLLPGAHRQRGLPAAPRPSAARCSSSPGRSATSCGPGSSAAVPRPPDRRHRGGARRRPASPHRAGRGRKGTQVLSVPAPGEAAADLRDRRRRSPLDAGAERDPAGAHAAEQKRRAGGDGAVPGRCDRRGCGRATPILVVERPARDRPSDGVPQTARSPGRSARSRPRPSTDPRTRLGHAGRPWTSGWQTLHSRGVRVRTARAAIFGSINAPDVRGRCRPQRADSDTRCLRRGRTQLSGRARPPGLARLQRGSPASRLESILDAVYPDVATGSLLVLRQAGRRRLYRGHRVTPPRRRPRRLRDQRQDHARHAGHGRPT